MKKNYAISILLFCSVILHSFNLYAQIQPFLYSFTSTPTLLSGTNNAVNSVYRFANVKTGTDAIVTIVSATSGAAVQILDDNNNTKPQAFSPKVQIDGETTGMIEFKIDFVLTGTLILQAQDSLYATAIDIDGTTVIHEVSVIDLHGGASSFLAASPEISVVQSGTKFTATNTAGIDYPGIDTSARKVMYRVRHNNVNSLIYKCGATNTSHEELTRDYSIYFNNFINPPGGPLSVKYLFFNAVVSENKVTLKWLTVQEINNSHFEVERSFDNNTYSTIGMVLDGFAVNGTGKSYQFKDDSPELQSKSIVYYRLKQFDFDGRVTYSKVLLVRLQAKAGVTMQVSPNPFIDNLTARFNAAENGIATIRISNAAGQILLSKQVTISRGYNNIQLDGLNGLANGMYVAMLSMNGAVIDNQRVIKN